MIFGLKFDKNYKLSNLKRDMKNKKIALDNRTSVNKLAIIEVFKWIQRNFSTEGKLAVGGWAKLKEATTNRRRKGKKTKYRDKILQDTGALRQNWIMLINKKQASITSGEKYASRHHHGDTAMNLPARPILPTNRQIMPALLKVYRYFVRTIIKR